jgi:hypothetical protein
MKNQILKLTLVLCLSFVTIKSNAYIEICFASGNCFITDGSCDGWCPNAPAAPTCTMGMAFNPNIDHIAVVDGRTWVITENRKFQVVSDNLAAFIKETKEKYKNANLNDQKVIATIQKEYKTFLKTDDGLVSPKRLALIQKETKLKVKSEDSQLQSKGKVTNSKGK